MPNRVTNSSIGGCSLVNDDFFTTAALRFHALAFVDFLASENAKQRESRIFKFPLAARQVSSATVSQRPWAGLGWTGLDWSGLGASEKPTLSEMLRSLEAHE